MRRELRETAKAMVENEDPEMWEGNPPDPAHTFLIINSAGSMDEEDFPTIDQEIEDAQSFLDVYKLYKYLFSNFWDEGMWIYFEDYFGRDTMEQIEKLIDDEEQDVDLAFAKAVDWYFKRMSAGNPEHLDVLDI